MVIVHVAPNASFTSGLGYQENLLLKYQARQGHDVTLIVSNSARPHGYLQTVPCTDEVCTEGFRVIRKKIRTSKKNKLINMFSVIETYEELCEIKPDIVFFHGFISWSIRDAIRYKKRKNHDLYIIQDNHEDYNIGVDPRSGFKNWRRCMIFRVFHKWNSKYIDQIYGVTPWRTEYAQKVYGADPKKCDTLIMGADDEIMDLKNKPGYRDELRERFKISRDKFVIVTGGKIDRQKRIIPLMKACREIEQVHLIVFGTVLPDVKDEFSCIMNEAQNISYTGWIDNPSIYKLFMGADLAVFPGQHSVLWEQACAAKIPCLFGRWEGMDHVNNGGNSGFIDDFTPEGLKKTVHSMVFTDKYSEMKKIAESEKTDIYLYSRIAQKPIDDYYRNRGGRK